MPNVDIALDLLIFCTKWFLNDRSADACPIKKGYIRRHLEFLNSIKAAAVVLQSDTDRRLIATHHNKVQGSGLLLYNAIVPCRGNFFNVLNARIVNPVGVKMWHDLQLFDNIHLDVSSDIRIYLNILMSEKQETKIISFLIENAFNN